MSILPLSTLRGPSPWTVPAVPEHENSPELSTPPEDLHDRLWLVRLRQPPASRTAATPAAAVNHRVPNLRIIPPHPSRPFGPPTVPPSLLLRPRRSPLSGG